MLRTEPDCWYTPSDISASLFQVFGKFDLDACAPADTAIRTIKAKKYFTAADDALSRSWKGRVFCNPPYDQKSDAAGHEKPLKVWIPYALDQFTKGHAELMVLLIPFENSNSTFKLITKEPRALILSIGRVKFGAAKMQGRHPSALCLFGASFPEMTMLAKTLKANGVKNVAHWSVTHHGKRPRG